MDSISIELILSVWTVQNELLNQFSLNYEKEGESLTKASFCSNTRLKHLFITQITVNLKESLDSREKWFIATKHYIGNQLHISKTSCLEKTRVFLIRRRFNSPLDSFSLCYWSGFEILIKMPDSLFFYEAGQGGILCHVT